MKHQCTGPCLQGHVLRWHEDHGTSQMPATEYIAMLEKELTALRKQVCYILSTPALCARDLKSMVTARCSFECCDKNGTRHTILVFRALACPARHLLCHYCLALLRWKHTSVIASATLRLIYSVLLNKFTPCMHLSHFIICRANMATSCWTIRGAGDINALSPPTACVKEVD